MCVVKELCWVSVQGCAQDCYIEEINLSSAIREITDLHNFRCQKLHFLTDATNCDHHVTVVIPAHKDRNHDRTRQLMREIKHTIIFQGLILNRKVLNW